MKSLMLFESFNLIVYLESRLKLITEQFQEEYIMKLSSSHPETAKFCVRVPFV